MKLLWLIVVLTLTCTEVMCSDSAEGEDTDGDGGLDGGDDGGNGNGGDGGPDVEDEDTEKSEGGDENDGNEQPDGGDDGNEQPDGGNGNNEDDGASDGDDDAEEEKTFSDWEPMSPSKSDCVATGSDGNGKCGTGEVTQHRTCQNGTGQGNTCSSNEELQRTKPCSAFGIILPECDPCATSPCLNGGTCTKNNDDPNDSSFTCECDSAWGGDKCQFKACTMKNGTAGNGKTQGTCPDKKWCHADGCKDLICKNGRNNPNSEEHCSWAGLDYCVYMLSPTGSIRTCATSGILETFKTFRLTSSGCRIYHNVDRVFCLCDKNDCN